MEIWKLIWFCFLLTSVKSTCIAQQGRCNLVSHTMNLWCLIKAKFMHSDKYSPWIKIVWSVFCILGEKRGNFLARQTFGHNFWERPGIILSTEQSASWSPFSPFCKISFYSCHKARLIVMVEAKLCCVSSPRRGGFRRTPKLSQRQPLKPTYFSTTRLSKQKRLWQLSRRRFCPFLLILACWVFHPTRDSDIYTKLSFSFWHINTVFAVVVVH